MFRLIALVLVVGVVRSEFIVLPDDVLEVTTNTSALKCVGECWSRVNISSNVDVMVFAVSSSDSSVRAARNYAARRMSFVPEVVELSALRTRAIVLMTKKERAVYVQCLGAPHLTSPRISCVVKYNISRGPLVIEPGALIEDFRVEIPKRPIPEECVLLLWLVGLVLILFLGVLAIYLLSPRMSKP